MTLADDIRKDRESGTPAPWSAFTDDTRPHTNIVAVVPRTACVFSLPGHDKREPDVRRIERVPVLEEAYLSALDALEKADELAIFVEECLKQNFHAVPVSYLEDAIIDYRKAALGSGDAK